MCGIVGFLKGQSFFGNHCESQSIIEEMSSRIAYRGPDDSGFWVSSQDQVALGHVRLSILDLTENGHQPMISQSGRFVIVFNGEIYNHEQLRQKINFPFKGSSDTETLLAAIEMWGIEGCLKQIEGMFAFAVFDNLKKQLFLARDRAGEKPLYFGWQGNGLSRVFLFGSELKALRAHPGFVNKLNFDSVHLYLKHNNVPAPYSIYDGINKLGAGEFAVISLSSGDIKISKYWSLISSIEMGFMSPFDGTNDEASKRLESLLSQVIKRQMLSDVPLGLFLSGGVDSSLVAALAQSFMQSPLNSFSIGFTEDAYNEAHYAKAVAKHLKTDHNELYISPGDAISVIPNLSDIYDEPFSDSSQIPMILVSRLARSKVTVALSGDGGDELFGGYNRYRANHGLLKKITLLPFELKKILSHTILSVSPKQWSLIESAIRFGFPSRLHRSNICEIMQKVAVYIASNSSLDAYDRVSSNWNDTTEIMSRGRLSTSTYFSQPNFLELSESEVMMAMDFLGYLPNDILTKVDRASMSASLEVRAPFLDVNLINFAWSLPLSVKINKGITKWILKDILKRYVPNNLIDRPKMGFGAPLGGWLRGPLRDWAEDLLSPRKLADHGLFNDGVVKTLWNNHLNGQIGLQNKIWGILMFQSWFESQNKS